MCLAGKAAGTLPLLVGLEYFTLLLGKPGWRRETLQTARMEVCPGCGTCTTKTRTAPGKTGWLIILVGLHPYCPCPCFCTQGILWLMTGEHLAGGSLVAEGPGSGHSISLYPRGCFSHPGFLPHFLPSSFLLLASKDGVDLSQHHLNHLFSSVVCKEPLHKNLY